jgi:hypothetical protein
MGNTKKIEIKELDSIKANRCMGVEENHNIEYKTQKEMLKRQSIRRL